MNCKNCGNAINEKEISCPKCGATMKRKKGILKKIIAALLILTITLTVFICGVEIGRRHTDTLPEAPDLIARISEAIQNIAVLPFEVEITQQMLTELVNKNAENLLPMENVQLILTQNKTLVFSANITKAQLEKMISDTLPAYISIFLPRVISLYIEAEMQNEDTDKIIDLKLKNVTAAGLTFSETLTESLGINLLLSDIITKLIESEQSPYFKVKKIYLNESKTSDETVIAVDGEFNLS